MGGVVPGAGVHEHTLRHTFLFVEDREEHDCVANMRVGPEELDVCDFGPSSFWSVGCEVFVVEGMAWRSAEMLREDGVESRYWGGGSFWMYSCLQRADGLLLENVAGEEEQSREYADLTGLADFEDCCSHHSPMPEDIATDIWLLVTSMVATAPDYGHAKPHGCHRPLLALFTLAWLAG